MTTIKKKNRSTKVISRLEEQLKTQTKTAKKSTEKIALSEKDNERIKKEISILKDRI